MLASMHFMDRPQSLPQRDICRGTLKERMSQRPEVKSRTAHKDWHFAPGFDLDDLLRRIASPIRGRIVDVWIHIIDQVMRHATRLFDGWLCGGDLDALVDLD